MDRENVPPGIECTLSTRWDSLGKVWGCGRWAGGLDHWTLPGLSGTPSYEDCGFDLPPHFPLTIGLPPHTAIAPSPVPSCLRSPHNHPSSSFFQHNKASQPAHGVPQLSPLYEHFSSPHPTPAPADINQKQGTNLGWGGAQ